MSDALTRDTVVQACLLMLKSANAQNAELRAMLKELRDERTELVKYVKSVDGLGDKVAQILVEVQEHKQNWILSAHAICAIGSATGVTSPLGTPIREDMQRTLDTAGVAATVPACPPAPVNGAAIGRELYDQVPREVVGRFVADEKIPFVERANALLGKRSAGSSSSSSLPDLVSASDSGSDGDAQIAEKLATLNQ